ncbi:glycosyltransferase family 4 protein [Salidesulfovibrio onnuriiensis]|uniref:glycosyltransferase family 4 protein n=1 Tax=Salidesulfovibrio onnuriiensis TaxID=2583823 RepID=UPI00164FF9FF|nr:glycosyltransferase family 4 protein [Salidesulfovibrio onnuriiensis]
MHIKQLYFAKKFILPSRAANSLQSLTMAYAFASAGVRTTLFPGFKGQRDHAAYRRELENAYGLVPVDALNLKSLYGGHKGIYGVNFRAKMAAAWFAAGPGTVFYSRDIKEALMLARLKRRFGLKRPLFFEMHEILAEQHRRNGTGREERFRRLELELLDQLDGVVVISPLLADDLEAFYAPDVPVFSAPMGFNEQIFSPVPDVDLSGQVNLAYAGSLYEAKGIHDLVEAMRHLPERFRLLVMGGNPGEELTRLRTMAAGIPGGRGRIEFFGHLSPVELAARLRNCHIFVIPQNSRAEFFSPIKLYEAMGLGLPMVVTPVPAISAVLEDGKNAVFAEDTAPRALARAVERLAGSQGLARSLQSNCREEAIAHTWKQRAKDCLDFMRDVLNRRE